jgi:hypothetical protein
MGLITALIGAAGLIAGGLLTWLTTRRASSGKIGTSEAAVLWEQAQVMRAELVAQLAKAVEQRDRLMESQSAQIGPALAAITESLRQITGSLVRLEQQNDGSQAVGARRARREGPPHR